MTVNKQMTLIVVVLCVLGCASFAQESLTPLQDELDLQTHAELWAGYDPRAEPCFTSDELSQYISGCVKNKGVVTINLGIYQDGTVGAKALQAMREVKRKIRK